MLASKIQSRLAFNPGWNDSMLHWPMTPSMKIVLIQDQNNDLKIWWKYNVSFFRMHFKGYIWLALYSESLMEAFKRNLNSEEGKKAQQMRNVNYRNSYLCKQSHQEQTMHKNIKNATISIKNVSILTPEIKESCTKENTVYSSGLALSEWQGSFTSSQMN